MKDGKYLLRVHSHDEIIGDVLGWLLVKHGNVTEVSGLLSDFIQKGPVTDYVTARLRTLNNGYCDIEWERPVADDGRKKPIEK